MDAAYVSVNELRPGVIVSEDVMANTIYPIVRKNTELSPEHIDVLRIFNIRKVKVEEWIPFRKDEEESDGTIQVNPDQVLKNIYLQKKDLEKEYMEAVQLYKKEFISWRGGIKPDITKIRTIILPLVERFNSEKKMLTLLNDWSDSKDYQYHHAIAVGILAAAISEQLSLPKGQMLQMGIAGVLADCGMAKIDSVIIEKAAFLSREEFNEVKKHAIYSYQMIQDSPLLRQEMKLAIFQHHERLDGSGYPRGDKFENVTLFSQILAVADVYHAMTSERVHRAKESPFRVIEMIKEEEFGKFNLKVVQALHNLVGNITIGTKVKLSTGDEGEVIFVHRDSSLRPMIKKNDSGDVIDLSKNRSIWIERVY